MSFDEWSRFRESIDNELGLVYVRLMDIPVPQRIDLPQATQSALELIQDEMDLGPLNGEKKWILQLYSDDLLSKFGGLNIVDEVLADGSAGYDSGEEGEVADGPVGLHNTAHFCVYMS